MKKLLTGLLFIATLVAAEAVHYDKAEEKKDVVSYGQSKTNEQSISKPNYPNDTLYDKKVKQGS